jgi:hypothetical protein
MRPQKSVVLNLLAAKIAGTTTNWINFLWPMVTGACLTLGWSISAWLRGETRAARLLFSVSWECRRVGLRSNVL